MNKFRIIIALFMISLLYHCGSTMRVHTDYDKGVDFSQYKTFDFFEIKEDQLKMKEVNMRRLLMGIELELGQKGIKRSAENPDLLINIYSTINRHEASNSNAGGVGYYGAASPYGTSVGISIAGPSSYRKSYTNAHVTFDVVDRKRNLLILESIAKVESGDIDDAQRVINYVVRKAFEKIPGPKKKKK